MAGGFLWGFSVGRSAIESVILSPSPLFEIARVLVHLDHIVSSIVNANDRIMCPAAKLCAAIALGLAYHSPPNGSASEIIAYGTMNILLVQGSFALLPGG
jgi:hypothetical protein